MAIRDRITEFVTYLSKQVYCSKGGILLGRVSGDGPTQEITVGSGLTLSGTTLTVNAQSWGTITGKPTTFTPSAHTHQLSGLDQSGATTGQIATWSGSAWTPATLATSTGGNGVSDAGKLVKFDSSGAIIASWFIFPNSQSLDGKTISPLIYPPDYGSTTVGTGFESIYKLPLLDNMSPDTVLAKTSRTDGAVSYNELVDVPAAVPLTSSKSVANAAARIALTLEQSQGFAVVDADTGKTWMLVEGGTPSVSGDWLQLGDRDIQWGDVGGKPSTFSPDVSAIADGSLTIAKTSGLQTALDGKSSISGANITNPALFKKNLEIPEHQIAVATSDTTGIQNVTPLDDAELIGTVEANATYIVRGKFCGTSTGDFSVGGMRVALSGPTCQDIFLRYQKRCYGNINGAVAAQVAGQFFTTLTGEAIQLSGVATNVSVYEFELDGIFTVGTSGGAIKVKFAQQNNGGAGLTRKSGSTFELLKL